MGAVLALLLGFGLAASRTEAPRAIDAEVAQCREWIQGHSSPPAGNTALTRIVSPRTVCFDGQIYSWTLKDASHGPTGRLKIRAAVQGWWSAPSAGMRMRRWNLPRRSSGSTRK
jgi:hypothetical protein